MMQKTIYNKYDKQLIASLPRVTFKGRIIVILTPGETEKAVRYLLDQPVLGFDTETRPSFRKGHIHKVSLMQVATEDTCFLFRLHHTGLTPALVQLLEDTKVTKAALSWSDDVHALRTIGDFQPGTFVELQKMVNELGIEDMSLQKLYANLFGQKISKRQQLTNWDADILTDQQKLYAATDAWACVQIYKEILRLRETGEYKLITIEEEKQE